MGKEQKHKLRKFINDLKKIRGRHTELVSVYIPAGYDIIKIINHLSQEQGTASNIKDKNTRKNVIDSLEKMIRHLRIYKKTPENGLAVFAGNISAQEGKTDLKVWSIEPPQPLTMRLYRCDHTFVLDELENFLEAKNAYGLIVIDKRDAALGLLKGTSIIFLKEFTSNVPGKTTKGGFSQQRYARIRELAAHEFFQRVGEAVNKEFSSVKDLKGILVGGPGMTKETFINGNYINTDFKKKVKGIKDLSYTGEFGLQELVDKSKDLLAKEEITKEKLIVQEFFNTVAKHEDKVAYGKIEVIKALSLGAVKKLLISEEFDEIEKFETLADSSGAEVHIISTESREGVQLRDIGGIAAILRFAI